MRKVKGTLETTFYTLIPFILYFSKSRITNGDKVKFVEFYDTSGITYTLHITHFISIGFTKYFKKK